MRRITCSTVGKAIFILVFFGICLQMMFPESDEDVDHLLNKKDARYRTDESTKRISGFKKAFDRVDHSILLHEVANSGIRETNELLREMIKFELEQEKANRLNKPNGSVTEPASGYEDIEERPMLPEELTKTNSTLEEVLSLIPPQFHKFLVSIPANKTRNSTLNLNDIRSAIQKYNDAQHIRNEELFGPVGNDSVIIAIQVHKRINYLRHLIVSLAEARNIDQTLLIFSHDYYDEDMNDLIHSIDFAKVMQIFYPYSTQSHPHEFPGVDPNDCPVHATYVEAISKKCNNALHPDIHGYYRNARYPQIKHHWWWKANRIFNQLDCTASHKGMVVFLEEDHYVAEDFLHMLGLLKSIMDVSCLSCEMTSLGTYSTGNWFLKPADTVQVVPWHSGAHNMGFAFNSSVWNSIMDSAEKFCEYDDYNWDISLLYLSQNRPKMGLFKVMESEVPRVFHIGECGLHHKKRNCSVLSMIAETRYIISDYKSSLYPANITVTFDKDKFDNDDRLDIGNGGWGDMRDRELCMNITWIGRRRFLD